MLDPVDQIRRGDCGPPESVSRNPWPPTYVWGPFPQQCISCIQGQILWSRVDICASIFRTRARGTNVAYGGCAGAQLVAWEKEAGVGNHTIVQQGQPLKLDPQFLQACLLMEEPQYLDLYMMQLHWRHP